MPIPPLKTLAQDLRRRILYATAEIVGLALGFFAATLILLYVAYEKSYDGFVDPDRQVYRVSALFKRADAALDTSQKQLAAALPREVAGITEAARLLPEPHSLRAGAVEYNETVY